MSAFKKILFPTDFSKNADHALVHAVRLADLDSGEVIIQHVVSDFFERHSHWATLFDVHELQKALENYIASHVKTILPKDGKVQVRGVVSKGRVADEISTLAEKELVDLVVMGSAKGNVTNKVIRMTSRPVLAVSGRRPKTGDTDPHKINKILVTTDFSNHSKKIMEYAFELKKAFNATLYMLFVIETSRAIEFAIRQGRFTDTIDKMRDWATNKLMNLTPDEFTFDPKVVRIVESGVPGDTIADVAFEVGADLTILGTHDYGTMHKHLLGTTTDKLLTKTDTPVLTVKL
jgi:nucleotide-binding universal stress UspA family protein